MLKLLIKTLGISFYEQHAGLFLVVCYLLFGAVEGSQLISYHLALLVSICSSPIVWSIVFFIWIAYVLKCYFFIKHKLGLPSYRYLTEITTLNSLTQHMIWVKVYAFMLLPILCYAVVMIYISIRFQYLFSLFATVIGVFVLLIVFSVLIVRIQNYNFRLTKHWAGLKLIKIKKPFWSWPVFYLFEQQPIVFFSCKLVSLLAFKAVLWMFADVGNDIRVFLTAMLAVVLSHAVLLFNWVKFDAVYLSFARTLKIKTIKRLSYWLIVHFIVLIPEFMLLAWVTHFSFFQLGCAIFFSLSTLFSLFNLVYVVKADMERYMKWLLFFFFSTMLVILAGHYMVASAGLLVSSILLFINTYTKIDVKEMA